MEPPKIWPQRDGNFSTIGLVVKFNVAIVEPRVRFSDGAADSQSLPRSLNGFMDADVMPDDVALPRRGVG